MINLIKKKFKSMKYTNCTVCNTPLLKKTAKTRVARSGAVNVPICNKCD